MSCHTLSLRCEASCDGITARPRLGTSLAHAALFIFGVGVHKRNVNSYQMHSCTLFSQTKCTHVPGRRKLPHGILEITPPMCQRFLMPKRCAQPAPNLLPHSNAKNTPRVAHPVQCFPLFRAPLAVGELMFGELKYNIIPIVHTRAGKLPHLKWTCPMLGIYGGRGSARRC